MTIYIPNDVAIDDFDVLTEESEILSLAYSPEPSPLGIDGPGGVGNSDELSYWFMADENLYTAEGDVQISDGDPVGYWQDVSGNGVLALQSETENQPTYVASSSLFNGNPAFILNGESSFLRSTEARVKEDITAFAIVSAENNPSGFTLWNEHGWIASAREPNGFIIHPWKDAFHVTGIIYDNEENEVNGLNTIFVPGINTATIHGMRYHNNSANRFLDSYVNGNIDRRITNQVERDAEDVVEVNFGRDFGDRWGAGLMAEQILYSERLYDTHTLLVRNYLSSKYDAPADGLDRYSQDELYNEDVAGIGQTTEYDKHLDAKGRGIIRMSQASDMDNGEFLLWGTSNGPLEWAWGDDVFLTGRVARTWGYHETGDVGTVLVQIYDETGFLDIDVNPGIIHLENETFEQGLTPFFVPLTNDGNGVWSAEVDFSGVGVFGIGVEPIVSVNEPQANDLTIFPNPASTEVRVSSPNHSLESFSVYDRAGRIVKSGSFEGETILDTSELANGVYVLRLTSVSGEFLTQKLEILKD